MMRFLRPIAEMAYPWGRVLPIALTVLFLWTAKGMALTPPPGTAIINKATVQYGDANGNPLSANSNPVSDTLSGAPFLRLVKTPDSDPVASGALFHYTLAYENTGNASATTVKVIDNLPAEVEFQAASDGGAHSNGTVTWDLGSLVSGAKGNVEVLLQVKDTVPAGSQIKNEALISSSEGASDETTIYTSIGNAPNLIITKSASPDMVIPGGIITYVIHYTNKGNQTAQGVSIRDDLPSGTAYVEGSITGNGTVDGPVAGRTITWDLGNLAPGTEGEVSFQVKTTNLANSGDIIRNKATIISPAQIKLSNEVNTLITERLSFLFVKTGSPDPVIVGNSITYTIEVTNNSATPLTNTVITDPLPENSSFITADNGGQLTGEQVVWDIGDIAAMSSQAVHLTIKVTGLPPDDQIINTATSKAENSISQSATVSTSVICRTKPEIEFVDVKGNPVIHYPAGANIYVQITDPDRNTDSNEVETISIVIQNPDTTDSEILILSEVNHADGLPSTNTGIFRACISTNTDSAQPDDGSLTVSQDTEVSVIYNDPMDILCGYSVETRASVFIDPLGIVFDSVTGQPVSGVIVTLIDDSTDQPAILPQPPLVPDPQANPVTTGPDGRFQFQYVYEGTYHLTVISPPDHVFPSTVPDNELAAGFTIVTGSRGESFTLTAGMAPLNIDIPVDPSTKGSLSINKESNKTAATIGDFLRYTVTIANNGKVPVSNVVIRDVMPHGIDYLSGSTRVNGNIMPDPTAGDGRILIWNIGTIPSDSSIELVYRASIGPDANQGDGTNMASASGISLGRAVASETASVKVKITEGVFTSRATIIGKVFIDANGDGIQKGIEEHGVPDVVIYLEDGTRVITDKNGKFSILSVKPGTHVIRVDETSLPEGFRLVPINNRFMGSDNSQFIDALNGGLFKANFAVQQTGEVREEPAAAETPSAQPMDISRRASGIHHVITEEGKTGQAQEMELPDSHPAPILEKEKDAELSLEEQILTMTPELEILKPLDKSVIARNSTRVIVKSPKDTVLTLTVNGNKVDSSQIGRRITNASGGVIIYEFIGVQLKPGEESLIKAEIHDLFGIPRGEKQIRVDAIGGPVRISIIPDQKEVAADGKSRINVRVSLEDNKGHILPFDAPITVDVTAGEIQEDDMDSSTEGYQILCQNGTANFTIIAPRETGEAKISVKVNDLIKSADIYFVPHLRPMLLSGMGEVTIGHGKSSGDTGYLEDRTVFDEGTYAGGRGALFVKGKIFKDVLLTAAYDSDKEKSDDLFRESETNLDTEDKYPIYGDESRLEYEAMSTDRLYVKLEKGKSSLLYGDYHTEMTDTEVSAYNRSFNGLKLDVQTDRFKLRSFGAYTNQTQVVDSLPAKGISGYYYLSRQSIMEGSERLVIEVRDRMQIDRVISREVKLRGSDYEIDYDTGTILFKDAVSSRDSNLNPIYIIVSYESEQGADDFYIYGGRGAYRITDWLEVGGTAITENKAAGDYELLGMDATLSLPFNTTFKAETAYTNSLFDIDNAINRESGRGWFFEFESRPTDKLSISGSYRSLDDYFYNQSAVDMMRGTTKYNMDALYMISPDLKLKAKYLDEKDELNNMSHMFSGVGVQKTIGKTRIDMDLSRETSNDQYIPETNPTNRIPFENSFETPHELNSIKLGIEREIWKDLTVSASHKQNIGGDSFHNTQAGLEYLYKRNRFYLREEYQKYQAGSTQTQTILGVESQVMKNTDAYNEYRVADGADGARTQQVIGLKTKMRIMDGLTGNYTAEYLSTIKGEKRPEEPDAFAFTTGLEYLPKDNLKMTGRFEYRNEIGHTGSDSYLWEIGSAFKVSPNFTILFRDRYFTERISGSGNHNSASSMLGLAYRPINNDSFNALAKVEYKQDRDNTSNNPTREDDYIFSLEGIKQYTSKLLISGRYAGKIAKDTDYKAYTDLISGRILYDLTSSIDISAEYRLFNNHKTNSVLHGGAVEAGYRIVKNLWVSVGYSFDDFDSDLIGGDYRGSGPYLKLRFKFDESLFKKSSK